MAPKPSNLTVYFRALCVLFLKMNSKSLYPRRKGRGRNRCWRHRRGTSKCYTSRNPLQKHSKLPSSLTGMLSSYSSFSCPRCKKRKFRQLNFNFQMASIAYTSDKLPSVEAPTSIPIMYSVLQNVSFHSSSHVRWNLIKNQNMLEIFSKTIISTIVQLEKIRKNISFAMS